MYTPLLLREKALSNLVGRTQHFTASIYIDSPIIHVFFQVFCLLVPYFLINLDTYSYFVSVISITLCSVISCHAAVIRREFPTTFIVCSYSFAYARCSHLYRNVPKPIKTQFVGNKNCLRHFSFNAHVHPFKILFPNCLPDTF